MLGHAVFQAPIRFSYIACAAGGALDEVDHVPGGTSEAAVDGEAGARGVAEGGDAADVWAGGAGRFVAGKHAWGPGGVEVQAGQGSLLGGADEGAGVALRAPDRANVGEGSVEGRAGGAVCGET